MSITYSLSPVGPAMHPESDHDKLIAGEGWQPQIARCPTVRRAAWLSSDSRSPKWYRFVTVPSEQSFHFREQVDPHLYVGVAQSGGGSNGVLGRVRGA